MTAAFPFISCDMSVAPKATGMGETRIKQAVANGELVAHYNGTKLVFRAVDLDEWIQTLPTERPER